MTSVFNNNRFLRIETQPLPPRSPAARISVSPSKRSATTTPSKSFMKSTASSVSKGVSSGLNIKDISTSQVTIPAGATTEREEILDKLKNNVIRFTRSSDRRMMLRTLKDCNFLNNIPVDDRNFSLVPPNRVDELKELGLEVASSIPFELNGMVLGISIDEKKKNQEGKKLLELLILLCNKLTQKVTKPPDNEKISSVELYRALLMRLSKKQSAETAYSQINAIIGCNELIMRVPKKPIKQLRNSNLAVFVADNAVHAVVEHHHAYGLFRKSDSAGKPWIGLTATTHERVNLSTGISVRRVAVQIHDEKFSLY